MLRCEPIYTGGNIYCFLGQIDDHTWFFASDADYDVVILNADPWLAIDPDSGEQLCWFPDWQEEHLIEYLDEQGSIDFFKDMLNWVKENEPDGNYLMSELEFDMEEVAKLNGTTNWR